MSRPVVEDLLTGYLMKWEEHGIKIRATNMNEKRGVLAGEIDISVSMPGYHPHIVHCTFNFNSLAAREKLIKTCTQECKEITWNPIIEQMRVFMIKAFRTGEPVRLMCENEVNGIPQLPWVIEPLVYENAMTVIYGDGGCGKSTFVLYLAGLLSIDSDDMPFRTNDFIVHSSKKVLYLDYESEYGILGGLFRKMYDSTNVFYRRCNMPLSADLEQIAAIIDSEGIGMIIVDSLGLACGGDLNEASTANQFALAIRKLKCTSLVIAHNAKNSTDTRTIYGSVYFHNNARNVWEIKKEQEYSKSNYRIGLFHRKCNLGKLQNPLSFSVHHDDVTLTYLKANVEDSFEDFLPASTRIMNAMKNPVTVQDLKVALDISDGTVRKILQRLKIKGIADKSNNKWFLIDNDHAKEDSTW